MPQCILEHVCVNIYIYEDYTDGLHEMNTQDLTEKKQQKVERKQTNTKCETNKIKLTK